MKMATETIKITTELKETLRGQKTIQNCLIAAVLPYFLEKNNEWLEQNRSRILQASQTQTFFQDNLLLIERGQKINLSHFLRKLDELGYEKVEKIEDLGEFAVRGGIVDIFPVNASSPIRLDFLGNRLENIFLLQEIFQEEKTAKERLKKKLKNQRIYSQLGKLKTGDFLVHLDHGVGRFIGIKKLEAPKLKSQARDYYILEYAKGDKLYVPVGLERKLSRYIAFSPPKIGRLGTALWQRRKRKVKESAEKLAKELLAIYSQREIAKRPAYLEESEFDLEIKGSFLFEETPDQIQTIAEINNDLSKEKPMDRIVCGDSGFGKTEVALRAMIRAVSSGYQAVLIAPTTILACQHFQNFSQRLKNLPLNIALISRLQTKREQLAIIQQIKQGKIDIIIGTHRLLSKDIAPFLFEKSKGLGLLVIDEEQRFGVKQKELLKKMRTKLDILSLSATPIPRTLYLALSHLRDISFVQTPPLGRKPVRTLIAPWSEKLVKKAINEELTRKGQVYYLHNRIETIAAVKERLEKLAGPKEHWKIGVVHGRMREKELVRTMIDFQQKKINVLLATTIIETGLDFPDVNTLIVADATRLGLAEAYQIKGRVGRSPVPAVAYFLYPDKLQGNAKRRLQALKEAEALGSGYLIAQRDLEIRGAGNILGKEQSGNVNAVGLNLYCQMIAQAIEKLENERGSTPSCG